MIFRTPEEKKDLIRSWNLPDRPFFAAGACHILAAAFLQTYRDAGYYALHIKPDAGFRGQHVLVSNGSVTFDYHGYAREEAYLSHYFSKIHRFIPHWRGVVKTLSINPTEKAFCQEHRHRMPDQYLHDPRPRAISYLRRFKPPN